MELSQALQNIQKYGNTFAKDEILCIREHKDEAIPKLLEFLASAIQSHKKAEEWNDNLDFLEYAMYLLAEFSVHEAFPLFAEILESEEEKCEWMLGDTLAEGMGSLVGSVAKVSDIDRIKSIAENTSLYVFQRTAAVNALIVLYNHGIYSRNDLITYFGHLLETFTGDTEFTSFLISYCYDVAAREQYGRIRMLFEKELADPFVIDAALFSENAPEVSEKETLAKLQKNSYFCIITDTIESMGSWACFNEDKSESNLDKNVPQESFADFLEDNRREQNIPIVKPPKVGRNDPCPCGSGQKYKRCCLGNV